jgi:hypothetical protein
MRGGPSGGIQSPWRVCLEAGGGSIPIACDARQTASGGRRCGTVHGAPGSLDAQADRLRGSAGHMAEGRQDGHISIDGPDGGLLPNSFRDRGVPMTEALGQKQTKNSSRNVI